MQTARDCSVVAVFANLDDARAAQAELRGAGFRADRIFSSIDAAAATSVPAAATRPEGHIVHWLKALFGSEEHGHFQGYQRALNGGQPLVGVDTSEADAVKATDIFARFSPINVHTDDFGTARGISTPDTGSGGSQGSESDYLNARDELAAVRVYPRDNKGDPATRL